MNPFAWLMKTEIRLNLEYLADHKVMESGTNKKAYQYHLLGLANQNRQTGLYNNFNLSHLKNRIKMMNKKKNPHHRAYQICLVCTADCCSTLGQQH